MKLSQELADPAKRTSLEARFWAKVDQRGADECWPWTAKAKHKFGYGVISAGRNKVLYSHWVSWALRNGPIPEGGFILHQCDVPECCNPNHLYLGDALQNVRDMHNRGRKKYRKHSAATRAKIAERRALNPPKQTEAARKSRAEAMRKRWQDPEWRARFTSLLSGKKNPRFGKRPPDHQIEAVKRAHRIGFKHSDETKRRMSEAQIKRLRGPVE